VPSPPAHSAAGNSSPLSTKLAADLAINPITAVRAHREIGIRGVLTTEQGTGTFVTAEPVRQDETERQRRIDQLVIDLPGRVGAAGVAADELVVRLQEFIADQRRSL
jgi:GntR family transcriptional regulator